MKKMSFLETTIPVGAECLYPTELEVRKFFNQQNLCGKIFFGVGYTDHMEKDLIWILQTPQDTILALWAFARPQPIKGNLTIFQPETIGNYIHRYQHNYLLGHDDILGLSIRELTIFSDETDIKVLLELANESFEELALINVQTSDDKKNTFACWLAIKNNNTAKVYPAFLEDVLIHRGFDPQKTSWNFLEVGDTFYHFNDKYRVDFDPKTGWYFAKVFHNPYMKIYTKNAI